ncbi:uncharacterized protein AMSG_02668 [Thecamonas trahens ATCC 50062]|uniref:Uncharacterized protein n=1 Tax=Thecamonas trahens ATCC 50062 TaxID=461836 RepID=A0A0L0D1S5_THETB|nr:hypothetical protein AMSG_02668 [Thecamonas trahens ATCC 50062]KNC46217.1 hypothetical protein AMSG_02668 [Thecamonas trahens ATCC 50062]|eukprot:XP_013760514.1 hypothetical protein AMSG_02668 [Thecamonas trahens ATCC 50062]
MAGWSRGAVGRTLVMVAVGMHIVLVLSSQSSLVAATLPTLTFRSSSSETSRLVTAGDKVPLIVSISSTCPAPSGCSFNITCVGQTLGNVTALTHIVIGSTVWSADNVTASAVVDVYDCLAFVHYLDSGLVSDPSNVLQLDVRPRPSGHISVAPATAFVGQKIGASVSFTGGGTFDPGDFEIRKSSPPYAVTNFLGTRGPTKTNPLYISPFYTEPFEAGDLHPAAIPTLLRIYVVITNTERGSVVVEAPARLELFPAPSFNLSLASGPLLTYSANASLVVSQLVFDTPSANLAIELVSLSNGSTVATASYTIAGPTPAPLDLVHNAVVPSSHWAPYSSWAFRVTITDGRGAEAAPVVSPAWQLVPPAAFSALTPATTTANVSTVVSTYLTAGGVLPINATLVIALPSGEAVWTSHHSIAAAADWIFLADVTLSVPEVYNVSVTGADALGVPMFALATNLVVNRPLSPGGGPATPDPVVATWTTTRTTAGTPAPLTVAFSGGTPPFALTIVAHAQASEPRAGNVTTLYSTIASLPATGLAVTFSDADVIALGSNVVFYVRVVDSVGAVLDIPANMSSVLSLALRPTIDTTGMSMTSQSLTSGALLNLTVGSVSGGHGVPSEFTYDVAIISFPSGVVLFSFPGLVLSPDGVVAVGPLPVASVTFANISITARDALGGLGHPLLLPLTLYPALIAGSMSAGRANITSVGADPLSVTIASASGGQPPYHASVWLERLDGERGLVTIVPITAAETTVLVPVPSTVGDYTLHSAVVDASGWTAPLVNASSVVTIVPRPLVDVVVPSLANTTAGVTITFSASVIHGIAPLMSAVVDVVDASAPGTVLVASAAAVELAPQSFIFSYDFAATPPLYNRASLVALALSVTDAHGAQSLSFVTPGAAIAPPVSITGLRLETVAGVDIVGGAVTAGLQLRAVADVDGGTGELAASVAVDGAVLVTGDAERGAAWRSSAWVAGTETDGQVDVAVTVRDALGSQGQATLAAVRINPQPSARVEVAGSGVRTVGESVVVSVVDAIGGTGSLAFDVSVEDVASSTTLNSSAAVGSAPGSVSLEVLAGYAAADDSVREIRFVARLTDALGAVAVRGGVSATVLVAPVSGRVAANASPPSGGGIDMTLIAVVAAVAGICLACIILGIVIAVCSGSDDDDDAHKPPEAAYGVNAALDADIAAYDFGAGAESDATSVGVADAEELLAAGDVPVAAATPRLFVHTTTLPPKPPPPIGFAGAALSRPTTTPGALPPKPVHVPSTTEIFGQQ